MSNNPLLHLSHQPPFDTFKPEHLPEAIECRLNACREAIKHAKSTSELTWEAVMAPLEEAEDYLSQTWMVASHLHSVADTPELRQVYEDTLGTLSAYHNERSQDSALYQQIKALSESEHYTTLSQAQKTAIEHELRDFKLSGIDLPDEQKAKLADIETRLDQLGSTFSNHLLDATQAWHYHTRQEALLKGLPEHVKAQAKAKAQQAGKDGWQLGLDIPTYLAVMTHAEDRALRATFYQAYTTRASDQGPLAGQFDCGPILEEILQLRQQKAKLVGFEHYTDYSLASKMAEDTRQVMDFLNHLADKSLPQAQKEFEALARFARETDGRSSLSAWDVAYYSNQLQEQEYAISQEALRPYFPINKVLEGLFKLVKQLFGLSIETAKAPTWHTDVGYFNVLDEQGQLRGSFYTDLYAREGKRGGAWMADYRPHHRLHEGLQHPVAFLNCNFAPPSEGNPALLTHDDVETLFHEFGHTLHHLVSQADVFSVSGVNGVAWDAVELPSQFMENFCWQKEVLDTISSHIDTGEPLPQDKLEQLLASKNFHAAMGMVRQLEFSLFDLRIHSDPSIQTQGQVQAALDEIRQRTAVLQPPEFNRFQNSFSHVFGGGYAAGYYSYKWAEVLSADAFGRFQEEGILNPETGRDFLHHILEPGGSVEPMQLFEKFRGRKPQVEALLKSTGIAGL